MVEHQKVAEVNLKEALLTQAPSLALQRAAADEIARLTKALEEAHKRIEDLDNRLYYCEGRQEESPE